MVEIAQQVFTLGDVAFAAVLGGLTGFGGAVLLEQQLSGKLAAAAHIRERCRRVAGSAGPRYSGRIR